ncbi:MAG: L-threonylcarbamoyladenylate synthase [Anaerolineae bacterium]
MPILPANELNTIEQAVALLRAGQVIVFPTDTVYGLGAHGFIASAVEKLFALKGREPRKAIPLLLASIEDVTKVAIDIPPIAWRLAERFWPGPVTLVLPKAATVLDVLTAGGNSIAVRIPGHEIALQLIAALGTPLAATSANLSGQPEAVTAEEAQAIFGDRVPLILDAGRCPGGVPSTVVDVTVSPPLIRRRGALVDEVESFLARFL